MASSAFSVDSFSVDFDLLADSFHSIRVEVFFLLTFGIIFAINKAFFSKPPPRKAASGVTKKQPRMMSATSSMSSQSSQGSGPAYRRMSSTRSSINSNTDSTLDTRSPTSEQLQNPAWVASAVQQTIRANVHRGVDLYCDALRAGMNLRSMTSTDSGNMFMAIVSSSIRFGRADIALKAMRDLREQGQGITVPLFSSATKLCTSKQLYKDCLVIYDFAVKDATLVVEDRSIWSCLLFCSVEAREYNRCAGFFDQIKACGAPSTKDFGNRIRSLSAQGDWKLVLAMLEEMRKAGVQIDSVAYNTGLATCVSANQTEMAQKLLEDMEAAEGLADVITYNTLAKGFAKAAQLDKCFELYERMKERGITPSQVTYGILLDCCINEKQMDKAAEVFNTMSEEGCVMNTILYTTLIKGFARADQVDQAMKVYRQMRSNEGSGVTPDLITFSILIKANCDIGRLEVSLGLLEAMMELGLAPDEVVFNNLLGGCVRECNSTLAKRLYHDMVEGGIRPSNATFSIMIRLFASCKLLDEAVEMLRTQPEAQNVQPEHRLYVQLAQACLRDRQGRRALEVYKMLTERAVPTAAMHASLLGMCGKLNMLDTGAEILQLACAVGAKVDARDVETLHEASLRKRRGSCADAIHRAALDLGIAVPSVRNFAQAEQAGVAS